MKIICSDCRKILNIPNERLQAFKTDIAIPCPNCNGKIEISINKIRGPSSDTTDNQSMEHNTTSADKLKKRILQEVNNLPPMPKVAEKARKILSNPESSFNDLASVVEADQAIATKVLRFANSPLYATLGGVSSVQQASVVLGTKTLMEILNMACASGILSGKLKGYDLDAGDLWQHSLAVASGSRFIAKKRCPELSEAAFSAGLIHDVGKVILNPFIVEKKKALQNIINNKKGAFPMAEHEILGFDHAEIASAVCDKWKIPSSISNAIKHHHAPIDENENKLAYIIHIADAVSMITGIGGGFDGLSYQIDDRAMEFLQFENTDIEILMIQISDCVNQMMETI